MRRRRQSAPDSAYEMGPTAFPEESHLRGLPEGDPRLQLALEQVLRGLTLQQGSLDNLRARAGTLVAASSLVSSFFGTSVLAAPHQGQAVLAMVVLAFIALVAVIIATVVIIWPYDWKWGIDGHRLLSDYIVGEKPSSLNAMRYDLTYHIEQDLVENEGNLGRLWKALRISVVAIALQVMFWSIALIL